MSAVNDDCPVTYHLINSTDCGLCSENTTSNYFMCDVSNTPLISQMCVISVQTVVCGNVYGPQSEPLLLVIKGL